MGFKIVFSTLAKDLFTVVYKKSLTLFKNNVIMGKMMLMKNERCLIKKIIKINEKIVKICSIFIGLIFVMGFYDERNILQIDLEEITIELGDNIPINELDYIDKYLNNSNFTLENNVPVDADGCSKKIGTYNYYIVYRDEERKYSRITNKRSTISVIDTIKPEIKLKETSLKFEYGSKIEATDIATCYDLSECRLYFENEVDVNKAGEQEVTVVAMDEGKNVNKKKTTITIKEKPKPVYYNYYYSGSVVQMNNYNNEINKNLTEQEKNSIRYSLVEFAKQFEGNPYVYGGNSLTNGTDCSGFVKGVYNNFGYQMPRTASDQGYMGISVSGDQLLPGDVVVYYYNGIGGHVGIYIGNGLMIHAGTPQTGIVIVPIFEGYRGYKRIIY